MRNCCFDLTASKSLKINYDLIKNSNLRNFVPLCYGGGISSTLEIRKLLKCFADKICLNNSILKKNRNLLINSIKIFGSQCIVASVDIIKNKKNDYFVYDTKNKK